MSLWRHFLQHAGNTIVRRLCRGCFQANPSNYADPSTNHAVVIIGWDDSKNAWLVRNSWGVYWGENGYAWVDYNTNNIGRRATWVVVKDEAQCNRKYEIKNKSR
ncbi:MAG: C1 family peptidase [Bacteroidia bacterium]